MHKLRSNLGRGRKIHKKKHSPLQFIEKSKLVLPYEYDYVLTYSHKILR